MSNVSVNVEKLDNNKVKLKIEVSAEKFEEGINKAYNKGVKYFNIPGFRKGKAPRSVIERYYGENILYEDAFNEIATEAYDEAIAENKVFPVSSPEVEIEQIGSGKNLIFTATIDVKPEIEVKDYKGIEIEKKEYTVKDEDIEHQLYHMQEKNSRLVNVDDRELKNGDISTIDFEGFVDGKPFEGGKGESYELEIGSGSFIPGFEEQLVGMKIDEEKEINVAFPDEYFSKDLAGKPATFKVTLHSIKMKELPALDDEFAKDVSEYETLKELKDDIKAKLDHENGHKAEDEMKNELVSKLIDKVKVDLPKAMVDTQIEEMVKDFEWNLSYKGMDLKTYLGYMNQTVEQFKEQFRPQAEKTVILELILEAVAKQENIDATEEQVEEKINSLAEEYTKNKDEIENVKKRFKEKSGDSIKSRLKIENTFNWIYDKAKIK